MGFSPVSSFSYLLTTDLATISLPIRNPTLWNVQRSQRSTLLSSQPSYSFHTKDDWGGKNVLGGQESSPTLTCDSLTTKGVPKTI